MAPLVATKQASNTEKKASERINGVVELVEAILHHCDFFDVVQAVRVSVSPH